jgi:hypothetical protein
LPFGSVIISDNLFELANFKKSGGNAKLEDKKTSQIQNELKSLQNATGFKRFGYALDIAKRLLIYMLSSDQEQNNPKNDLEALTCV